MCRTVNPEHEDGQLGGTAPDLVLNGSVDAIAHFIVNRSKLVLALTALVSIVAALMFFRMSFNADISSFLLEGNATGEELVALQEKYETTDPINVVASLPDGETFTTSANVALIADQWKKAGIDVELKYTEQAQPITDALMGNFDVNLWRQFGSPDPDGDSVWWFSKNADPPLSLNFARYRNPEVDKALMAARATNNFEKRKKQYGIVAKIFNKDVPYIWLDHDVWGIAWRDGVESVVKWKLPDGKAGLPDVTGAYSVSQIWLNR